jgi:hypothetical protein
MVVDARGADPERYLQEDPGGPVVMLGLLRFALTEAVPQPTAAR